MNADVYQRKALETFNAEYRDGAAIDHRTGLYRALVGMDTAYNPPGEHEAQDWPIGPFSSVQLLAAALKITSEAGEIAGTVDKLVFQGHEPTPESRDELLKDAGDLLWSVSVLCLALGTTMGRAMEENLRKLAIRYGSGRFTAEDSVARVDQGGSAQMVAG